MEINLTLLRLMIKSGRDIPQNTCRCMQHKVVLQSIDSEWLYTYTFSLIPSFSHATLFSSGMAIIIKHIEVCGCSVTKWEEVQGA